MWSWRCDEEGRGGPAADAGRFPPWRLCGDAGVAVVELALVIVIVVMLLLGMLTGGLSYYRKITITDAARIAARYGTVHAMPTSFPSYDANCSDSGQSGITSSVDQWLVDVACDAIYNAQGELDAGSSGRVICVTYVPSTGETGTNETSLEWDQSANSGSFTTGQSCAEASTVTASSTDAIVQVVTQRTGSLEAVVWNQTLHLQSAAYGRYEEVSSQ